MKLVLFLKEISELFICMFIFTICYIRSFVCLKCFVVVYFCSFVSTVILIRYNTIQLVSFMVCSPIKLQTKTLCIILAGLV